VTSPSPRLLNFLLIFIGSTLLGSLGRGLGAPGVLFGVLFGGLSGWVAARWIMRKLF
jgi:hypothetical protein